MATDGYVQVAADGAGKRIGNFAVVLPVGTAVVDGDGATSYLAAATTVFLQRVVLTDATGNTIDRFTDADWQAEVLNELKRGRRLLQTLAGEVPTED